MTEPSNNSPSAPAVLSAQPTPTDAEVAAAMQAYHRSFSSDPQQQWRDALTAAFSLAAPAGMVEVKPLEWELQIGSSSIFIAETSFGRYTAWLDDSGAACFVVYGLFPTVRMAGNGDTAKAAAQADYEKRIRSALLPPQPSAATNADMLAALKRIVTNWDGEPEDTDETREAIAKAETALPEEPSKLVMRHLQEAIRAAVPAGLFLKIKVEAAEKTP